MDLDSCFELIEAVSAAETVEALHTICADACWQSGFERFIYGARIPTSFVKPHFIFISGYPKDWRKHYAANNYMVVDPTVQYCSQNITPLVWDGDSIRDLDETSPEIRRFMGEAMDFGIRNGISFPLHSVQGDFAMLSFASEQNSAAADKQIQRVMPMGQLFTAYLHEAVRRVFSKEMLAISSVGLTHREKECLLWAAEGKTAWEISRILKIAERTVTFHLQNVQGKLGVSNRQQAVARAVSMGMIEPQFSQ
ncbi:Autoinducer-binding transcriptional regulator, LuxR family [hydrothermal vent metagenome]|uniref:Autoinducer-binding transcriptional regulator, LuxR family n=1 Tax=hydrothermal vent metagenome TaxID=652676 RepID=A0A3B0Z4V6_9ZZZZ